MREFKDSITSKGGSDDDDEPAALPRASEPVVSAGTREHDTV
jgi:hypothetical protein